MRILSTLPEEYFEFRTIWESVPRDQRSIEYLLERLAMVEMRVTKRQCDTASSTMSALVANECGHCVNEGTGKPKPSTGHKTKPKKIKCYNCHKFGHTKYKCPKNKKPSSHMNGMMLCLASVVCRGRQRCRCVDYRHWG